MLSLEEAQAKLLALAPETYSCGLGLSHAAAGARGYLAKDVNAHRTQPAADLSAMDGYAISGEGPWKRIGEARAGAPFEGSLQSGQCVRISTGALMPEGAESVLIQENAAVDGSLVTLAAGEARPEPGRHVRVRGFDFEVGERVLEAGTRLTPARMALALAAGRTSVPVVMRPSVAVLDSGDELVPVGKPLAPHQIPASNGAMISWMLAPLVGLVDERIGPVPDGPQALATALRQAENCHILITSGGASVGDHDLVQDALREWGAKIDFWKVAIKPGKPLMVATKRHDWGDQVILGLPGNPVSSFVTAFLFALPLVRAAMGAADPLPKPSTRIAAEDLPATGSRREFLRGVSDGETVHLAGSQDSSALMALARANCLIDRPAGADPVRAGERVPVYNLQNG
ncbi:MAG: molybdopterin molybdotransferase MoeA [Erythrobacter sp.]|uniref:molybdopterin molybdotransferase MoeA n=1 Tax=Erythrobacter sp. TaxID=1042 RepID=UPI0026063152|nr:molybdopterin molybdotransferase MoeA [Erythrobacter sp.]MDJ0977793.1 molybdopterin molybdotransferase MoeA [Erythrobacter sp.]